MKTGVVEFKTLHDEMRVSGNVEVDETRLAWVQVRFSGWIQRVFADAIYKPVEKGQKLFTIYSPEIAATEQEYLLARENRESAGAQHRAGRGVRIGFVAEGRCRTSEAMADSGSRHRSTGSRGRCSKGD